MATVILECQDWCCIDGVLKCGVACQSAPCSCPCGDDEGESWANLYNGVVEECGGLLDEYNVSFDIEIEEFIDGDCDEYMPATFCNGQCSTSVNQTVEAAEATCRWVPPPGEDPVSLCVCDLHTYNVTFQLGLDTINCKWTILFSVGMVWYIVDLTTAKTTGNTPVGNYTDTSINGCALPSPAPYRVSITNIVVTEAT